MKLPRSRVVVGGGLAAVLAIALVTAQAAIPAITQLTSPAAITQTCSSPPTFPSNPIWCFTLGPEPNGAVVGANSWEDEFNTGINFGALASQYRVINEGNPRIRTQTFQHANHWMVDMVDQSTDRLSGGVLLSPNKKFQFENGKLVIEADAAAGCGGDGPGSGACNGGGGANAFYEIDITPAINDIISVDDLYGYGMFGTVGAMGCRLEKGNNVCAMYDNSGRATDGRCVTLPTPCNNPDRSGRLWETQGAGTALTGANVQGGYPDYVIPGGGGIRGRDVFRICDSATNPPNAMPDSYCRDRFRMEVTQTTLTIFVNGYQWFKIDGLAASNPEGRDVRIPASWLSGGVYVYLTSWINGGQHSVNRFHWDRIAVNSGDPLSAAPSYCRGAPFNTCDSAPMTMSPSPTAAPTTPAPTTAAPTPTPTPTPSPLNSPTPTIAPTTSPPTPSPTVLCEAMVRLNGVVGWAPQPPSFCAGVHP